jgi:hypothetical protein
MGGTMTVRGQEQRQREAERWIDQPVRRADRKVKVRVLRVRWITPAAVIPYKAQGATI